MGVGRFGRHHARLLGEAGLLQAVCDDNAATQAQLRGEGLRVLPFDALLAEVDAVVVATPASTHERVVGECLRAGKHVLVEKPFTLDALSSEKLMRLASDMGLVLCVGYTFLHDQGFHELRRLVRQDAVGSIRRVFARRTAEGPVRTDVSAVWDLAAHDVSILLGIGASPRSILASGRASTAGGVVGTCFLSCELGASDHVASAAMAHIHVSWDDPARRREFVVEGERGRLIYDGVAGEVAVEMAGKTERVVPSQPRAEPLRAEQVHFLGLVEQARAGGGALAGPPPLGAAAEERSSAELGLEVTRVLGAAEDSLNSGRSVSLATYGEAAPAIIWRPVRPSESAPVPLVDVGASYLALQRPIDEAIAKVLRNGMFIGGGEVSKFEEEFANVTGSGQCISVNSGTDALWLIYHFLGLHGEEVLVPANTFCATAIGLERVGARVVLCDVDTASQQLTVEEVEQRIVPGVTKALVVVHLHGHMTDMGAMAALCNRHGVLLVEDASQAHDTPRPPPRSSPPPSSRPRPSASTRTPPPPPLTPAPGRPKPGRARSRTHGAVPPPFLAGPRRVLGGPTGRLLRRRCRLLLLPGQEPRRLRRRRRNCDQRRRPRRQMPRVALVGVKEEVPPRRRRRELEARFAAGDLSPPIPFTSPLPHVAHAIHPRPTPPRTAPNRCAPTRTPNAPLPALVTGGGAARQAARAAHHQPLEAPAGRSLLAAA